MLIKFKPTTPGLRGTVLVSKKELSKNKPHKSLTKNLLKNLNLLAAEIIKVELLLEEWAEG